MSVLVVVRMSVFVPARVEGPVLLWGVRVEGSMLLYWVVMLVSV